MNTSSSTDQLAEGAMGKIDRGYNGTQAVCKNRRSQTVLYADHTNRQIVSLTNPYAAWPEQ